MTHSSPQGARIGLMLLAISTLLLVLGVCVGSSGFEWPDALLSNPQSQQLWLEIRLPRSVAAYLAGALFGLAGALAQGLFRNPLADPYLLGSASGASLGVAVALAVMNVSPFTAHWLARLGITGAAFAGSTVAVMLTLTLAQGVQHTLRLLLSGVIVGVVLGALSALITLLFPDTLQAMQAFVWGSSSFASWSACLLMAVVLALTVTISVALSRVLDGLILGESTAITLGLKLAPLRIVLVLVLAFATGAAVAQVGLVAFVGLAAPHLVRSTVRVKHAWLITLSALAGGVLLLAADIVARGLIAPEELPVGVITAVLGGFYLLWLMHKGQNKARTL